ncbi:MAG: hypothetical protein WCA77_08920 [Thermoplasmata archaeon]
MASNVPAPISTAVQGSAPRVPGVVLLRICLGLIGPINLLSIMDAANQILSSFTATALPFAPRTLSGPGLANAAATHPTGGSGLVAAITICLAIGLPLGVTTRAAYIAGTALNAALSLHNSGSFGQCPAGPVSVRCRSIS